MNSPKPLTFAGTRWALNATTDGISDAVLEGWAPIGTSNLKKYTAIFEGNGYTITGLYINRPSISFVGLFGYAGADAIIRNVFLEEGEVHAFLTLLAAWWGTVRAASPPVMPWAR